MKRLTKIILLIFILALPGPLSTLASERLEATQLEQKQNQILTVNVVPVEKPVHPGETFDLILELTVASGYHINSDKPEEELLVATSVEIKKDPAFEIMETIFPKAKTRSFKFSPEPLSVFEGKFKIKIKIELAEDFCGQSLNLEGKVHYQACQDEACLRPDSLLFKTTIPIAGD